MGLGFNTEDANLISAIINKKEKYPKLNKEQIYSFLDSINGNNLFSSDSFWIDEVIRKSHLILDSLESINRIGEDRFYEKAKKYDYKKLDDESDEYVTKLFKNFDDKDYYIDNDVLKKIFKPIKEILSNFELFGILVFKNDDKNAYYKEMIQNISRTSLENALILIPNDIEVSSCQILTPVIDLDLISRVKNTGILFWDKNTNTTFIEVNDLIRENEMFHNISESSLETSSFLYDSIINKVGNNVNDYEVTPSILHLSDIHMGRDDSSFNSEYLISHIKELKNIAHIVITGDVLDSPSDSNKLLFENFMYKLGKLNVPISFVAGNHDIKNRGFLQRVSMLYNEIDFVSNMFTVNHHIETIFFGINSNDKNINSYLAKGHVSDKQLLKLSMLYRKACFDDPRIKSYKKIALIHHHPFKFTTKPTNFIKKTLLIMEEQTLKFNNADYFINWCSEMGVFIILHGHKHMQRFVECTIDGNKMFSLGCGTSTAIKRNHFTYNLINLDDSMDKYSFSCYASKPSGSGFFAQLVKTQIEHR